MSLEDRERKEIIASIPIVEAKLQVNRRVMYRASAGCVDRLGTVMGVYETLINGKYGFPYSVKLDPITVNTSSIQIRSDAMIMEKTSSQAVELFLQSKKCGTIMCLVFS